MASISASQQAEWQAFKQHLRSSKNILALCGAGLSAASGLPTFRGAGGLWRSYDAVSLATPEAFARDPSLVWHFYSYRRHMALQARPNPAHYALAELAKRRGGFHTLTQNVDGLSQRAGHPPSQLHLLHGSLFDIKCSSYCDYFESNNFTDPIVPALAIPQNNQPPAPLGVVRGSMSTHGSSNDEPSDAGTDAFDLDISDDRVAIRQLNRADLPMCPQCKIGLLRPGVVWFGEALPAKTLQTVDGFINQPGGIDLIMVIGTSAKVYPAAAYVDRARLAGAKVAVFNTDTNDVPGGGDGINEDDWFFQGDAGIVIPEILRDEIGDPSK